MISTNSFYNFVSINTILYLLALFQYNLYICIKQFNGLLIYFVFVSRNYFLINFVEYGTKHKPLIHKRDSLNLLTYYDLHFNVWRTTLIETITHFYIESYIINKITNSTFIYEIAYFIPVSFIFEIIFDFFHYFAHRLLHHRLLYKYAHKIHHKFENPIAIATFYQDPVDLLITNSFPTILAFYLTSHITCLQITFIQYNLIIVYKSLIEISGHCGRRLYPTSSFTQFIWLPKLTGIELYTEDHDLHHSQNNCNYGKRFSFWDKIFGTYKSQ
uniref:Fatty acid hydroxylase domain-containing protein n=1 Tax=viral metagenome TaxID=1070528 RepID=A0A6C0HZ19_9ZZZZ